MDEKTKAQREIEQLERVRATWVWTLNNALERINAIDLEIKSLTKAKQNPI